MSQDTSMHNTNIGEGRPSGTEDLLPGHQGEREPLDRGGDQLDQDRLDGDRMDTDQLDQDRMDVDRTDAGWTDADGMGAGRMDADHLDADHLDAGSRDADQMDADRLHEGHVDGAGMPGAADPTRGGQWTDEETTAQGDRIVDQEIDGELGDVGPSEFGQPQGAVPAADTGDGATPLFAANDVDGFRSRWTELQGAFVDDPRTAVQQADQLVAEVMQTLAATFARNKQDLEGQWQREGTVDTEDLRQALRRYRRFFDQLLRN